MPAAAGSYSPSPSTARLALAAAACCLFPLSLFLTEGVPKLPLADRGLRQRSRAAEPAFDAMNQYSLWAMPAQGSPFHERSAAAIKSLSARMQCVPFEPHVTVIGAFGADQGLAEADVVARSKSLCKSIKPYTVRVQDLSSGSLYFQCVYLKMVPEGEVMEVNRKAREAMGMDTSTEYMPHLSLLYGDLTEEQKEEAKDAFRREYSDLNATAYFEVDAWALYRTNPRDLTTASWEKLGVYPLEG